MVGTDRPSPTRRAVLGAIAGAGCASIAGCSLIEAGEDGATSVLDDEAARRLATRFAPTFYFDEHEKWFPTDPRPYETTEDGKAVVDGFEAFDGYAERFSDAESPPDPTVFYHAVGYDDSPLAAVQFWCYSVFDQFTTNFHWHDWEALTVFVDRDDGAAQLYVASSHSRNVPNNEFLDPDGDRIPRVLSELGSHSSALSVNDERDRFRRLPDGDLLADVTNGAIEGLGDLAELPAAYGLPRDEGFRLPFVVPELAGAPLYEHDRLQSVDRTDLVDADLTIGSLSGLSSPPTELPTRETGLTFQHEGREERGPDVRYELRPTAELEHIADFVGPQLSFEFEIPAFAEDAIANHITTTGVPWNGERYDNPAADITDPRHRAALAERYDAIGDPGAVSSIVAAVSETVASPDAPPDEGLTTEGPAVESFALIEGETGAVPTFGGTLVVRDAPEGERRLTVNGAGFAPHDERVSAGDDGITTPAGVNGEIPLVAREDAVKLEIDPDGTDDPLTDFAVEDDFAGRLYDAPLAEPDAVYVHRGGAYTAEVGDAEDEVGAYRVNPTDESAVRLAEPRTGRGSLASYVADLAEETSRAVERASGTGGDGQGDGGQENAVRGLARALAAVADAARRAAERAEAGERGRSDESLRTVEARLERAADRLAAADDDLPAEWSRATERRLGRAEHRSDQARDAETL